MKSNQKGFGAVEVLVLTVVTGLLGGAGWYVYSSRNNTNEIAVDTTNATTAKTEEPTNQQPDEYAGWKTYADSKWNFEFKYPTEWSQVSKDYNNGGNDTRDITIKSPNYSSDTQSVIEVINAGAVIRISANDTDMADFSETGLKQNEAYKETTVAGVDAVYYIGKGKAFSYALIKNRVMYNLSLRTVGDNKSEETYKPIFEKLVKSFQIK